MPFALYTKVWDDDVMSKRAKLFRVHQSVGVLAVAFFTVTAITGLLLTIAHLKGEEVPVASNQELLVSLESLVEAASSEVDAGEPTGIVFASADQPSFRVDFDDPGHTRVYLDGSGEVLASHPAGRRFSILSLHTGRAGGVLGQLLAALNALALLLMGYTGLAMARARKCKKGDRVAQARARREPAES